MTRRPVPRWWRVWSSVVNVLEDALLPFLIFAGLLVAWLVGDAFRGWIS